MVRILVLKQLYNLSDEQMEYQLLDRMSYQRFCLLEHSLNVPDRNTIWRFGQLLGIDGATALFEGAELQLRRHGYIARGGQAIDATLCIDPAFSAQVRPLKHMPQREFSYPALGVGVGCCKSQSSLQ